MTLDQDQAYIIRHWLFMDSGQLRPGWPCGRWIGQATALVVPEEPGSMLALHSLLDDRKCYETVRRVRWPDGVRCPHCGVDKVSKQGFDRPAFRVTQKARQKYRCKGGGRHFDDLTATVFAGHHQPLRVWIGCLYLMGLNVSNRQIAHELGLNESDAQRMSEQLRQGVVAAQPEVELSGTVECDEVYVVAGHKGRPEAVVKKGARGGVGA